MLYSLYEVSSNVFNRTGMGICVISIANNLSFQQHLSDQAVEIRVKLWIRRLGE